MLRSLISTLAAVGLVIAIAADPAAANRTRLSPPIAAVARACHNHAGKAEGDGEYTDGAIQDAYGISCNRALALVKPRYHWINAHWHQTYRHGFRIGAFSCHITPQGPNALKTCVDRNRRFDFF